MMIPLFGQLCVHGRALSHTHKWHIDFALANQLCKIVMVASCSSYYHSLSCWTITGNTANSDSYSSNRKARESGWVSRFSLAYIFNKLSDYKVDSTCIYLLKLLAPVIVRCSLMCIIVLIKVDPEKKTQRTTAPLARKSMPKPQPKGERQRF